MNKNNSILLSAGFLLGLLLLILNDFLFKAIFHNWITGKLSDIAGLFVFSLFCFSFFPSYKKPAGYAIAIFFTIWKSEFIQPAINLWNLYLPAVHRTVDYSDILAVPVISLAYLYEKKYKGSKLSVFFVKPVCTLAVFSFFATTISIPTQSTYITQEYKFKASKQQLLDDIAEIDNVSIFTAKFDTVRALDKTIDTIVIAGYTTFLVTLKDLDTNISLLTLISASKIQKNYKPYLTAHKQEKLEKGDEKMIRKYNSEALKERQKILKDFEKHIIRKIKIPIILEREVLHPYRTDTSNTNSFTNE